MAALSGSPSGQRKQVWYSSNDTTEVSPVVVPAGEFWKIHALEGTDITVAGLSFTSGLYSELQVGPGTEITGTDLKIIVTKSVPTDTRRPGSTPPALED